jgi:hypothetical protein
MDRETSLRKLYAAFNDRDIDAALAGMVADVDWPNAWEGGRVVGHDEVRAYWTRQWTEIDSSAEPLAITARRDGRVDVRVHLVGRSPAGDVLFDEEAVHVYLFRGELVERMTIEPPDR